MRPPLVRRKFTPLAQSSELPPPTAAIRSILCVRANTTPAATSRSVGFSFTPSKTNASSPASRTAATARCGCPAASRPGSVTRRTRVPPSSRHTSPRRARVPGPKTTRPSGWKSNPGGGAGVLERPLLVEVGEQVPFMRLVPRQAVGRQRPDVQPLDRRAGQGVRDEGRVVGEYGGGQGVADPLQHVILGPF